MKPTLFALLFFLLISCLLFNLTSCKTTKDASNEKLTFVILLKDRVGPSHINENYAAFHPQDVKKSNRTLNQYRTNFNCSKTEKSNLMKALGEDPNIIEFTISENKGIDIKSGKNDKSSKVKINK